MDEVELTILLLLFSTLVPEMKTPDRFQCPKSLLTDNRIH